MSGVGFGTWQVTVQPGTSFVVTSQQSFSVTLSSEQPEVTGIDFCVARESVMTYLSPIILTCCLPDPPGVLPKLDLEIDKSASSLNVRADAPLDYTLDVVNHGPFDAENVTVVDTLPAGTTFITGTVSGGGFCAPPNPSLEVTCYLPNLAGDGSILSAASVTIQTNSPDAPGTVINNTATVFNGTTALDTDLSNNTDSVTVTVRSMTADLSILIADSP